MPSLGLKSILGQPSWKIAASHATAYLTELGGHIGPVQFTLGNQTIEPLSVAPWHSETLDPATPNIIKALRGDFFCLPFGGNTTPFRGERHGVHGETANENWSLETYSQHDGATLLHASLVTKARPGRVDKHIILRDGETAVYQKHIITGMSGPMNFGHHAMVKFPDAPNSGLVSTSPAKLRQVWLESTEDPVSGGYSALEPGAVFKSLDKVPTVFGTSTDLSRFPARPGYEDIVINVNNPRDALGWTAVVFPKQRYLFYSLKDPRQLAATLFWISNGGRHYAPWNGRHKNVIGIEEITSFFHSGLAQSAKPNPLSKRGIPTVVQLSPKKPLIINYIFGIAPIPAGFDHVKSITPTAGGIELTSRSGKRAATPLDISFLQSAQ